MADRIAQAIVWLTAVLITSLFVWLIADLVWRGSGQLSWSFLVEPPADFGLSGGIGPILVSTLLILLVCLAVSVPLGMATAVLLAEYADSNSRFGRLVRRSLDTLAGVPSIVFGLFGNAFFCFFLGMGFSILSGGLTLACMVLPILIRSCEEGFRSVPDDYRRAAAALGLSRTTTLWRLLLPAALPGLAVGLVLGIGRALAETAALLFTSGSVDRTPGSLLDSGRSLSIHVYELAFNVTGGEPNACAAALVLVALLLLINTAASTLMDRWLRRRLLAI